MTNDASSASRDQLDQTQRALRESESRFRLLADSIPQLAWMARPDGWIFWYNKRWFDYSGTTFDDMQGWGWRQVHHPDHVDRVVASFQTALQTGEPWEATFPLLSRDKKWRWFLSRAMPVQGDDNRIDMWFGTNTDITEMLDAEARQRNLLDELNHRVKNTLSVVQSVASQTIKGSEDLTVFREKFEGRLLALSKSHNLLAKEVWQGATLVDVVRESLEAYEPGDAGRVLISGPRIMLGPTAAVTLGMAFHELATNSAKYGSLSEPQGTVDVQWFTDFRGGLVPAVVLTWKELGGPRVTPPTRTGFGSRLLNINLATELNSHIVMDFRPEGLVFEMRVPLSRTVTLDSTSAA